ncbi:MAG TPA: hypothetical protein VG733_03085 [Chthoniobacteraceae bacterium]|nr:hypothetical protein [Chthoniobacteraceae bacterium]
MKTALQSPSIVKHVAMGRESPGLFVGFIAIVLLGLRLPAEELFHLLIFRLRVLGKAGRKAPVENDAEHEGENQKQRNPKQFPNESH